MLTSESNTALEAKRAQLQMELARIDFELARRSSEWSRQMQQDKRLWLMERPADERRLTTAELEPTLLAIGDKHVPTQQAAPQQCRAAFLIGSAHSRNKAKAARLEGISPRATSDTVPPNPSRCPTLPSKASQAATRQKRQIGPAGGWPTNNPLHSLDA